MQFLNSSITLEAVKLKKIKVTEILKKIIDKAYRQIEFS